MKLTQKATVISLVVTMGITMPASIFATEFKDDMNSFRQAKKEIVVERKELFQELKERAKNALQTFVNDGKAIIIGGTITAKTDTTLTVTKDGKSYAIQLSDNVHLRRRFWGKSSLTEFSVGNTVNVYGAWTDETKTSINAKLIRNISIQKRFGVFIGQVKSLLSNGWVITPIGNKRADQTVTIDVTAKITDRRGETISQSDVVAGHRIRVKGLWDMSANTITEVKEIKDFGLPVTVKVSVTPTATLAPTSTPSL